MAGVRAGMVVLDAVRGGAVVELSVVGVVDEVHFDGVAAEPLQRLPQASLPAALE